MKLKSPTEPIFLSEKSYNSLEALLKRNEQRASLSNKEKELLKESKDFDTVIKTFIDERERDLVLDLLPLFRKR